MSTSSSHGNQQDLGNPQDRRAGPTLDRAVRLRILYEVGLAEDDEVRCIFEIADHLASTGQAEVRLIAGWHTSRFLQRNPRPWVSGRYLPASRWLGKLQERLNSRATQRAIGAFKPDVVHRTDHCHAARFQGIHKTVVTIHDVACFEHPEFFTDAEIEQQRLKGIVDSADHLISYSTSTRDDVIRIFGIERSRISVTLPGARLHNVHTGSRPAHGDFFLFVGQRAGYKNFGALLHAVATTPTLSHTRVVAFGGDSITAEENRLLASLNLRDRVVTLQGDDAALAGCYSSAIALVHPTLYEASGFTVIDAMAHGCPVACSRTGCLPELAGDAVLYFDPADSNDIGTTLVHLAADSGLRERLAEAGRARAANFEWSMSAKRALECYRTIPNQR